MTLFRRVVGANLQAIVNTAANVVTIVAGIAASVFLYTRLPERKPVPEASPVYDVSERLPVPLPVSLGQGERIVMLSLRSSCRYCTESMAFYRKLQTERSPETKLVVVGLESIDKLTEYAERYGLKPDAIRTVEPGFLRTSFTPFLVVTDSERTILGSWAGLLTPARETEVLDLVRPRSADGAKAGPDTSNVLSVGRSQAP